MRRSLLTIILVLTFSWVLINNVAAEDEFDNDNFFQDRFAATLKVGTLGGGFEGIMRLNDNFDGRLGGSFLDVEDFDNDISDIEYEFDLELITYSAILDFYPGKKSFRISVGAFYLDDDINIESNEGSFDLGNDTYTSGEVGILSGDVSFKQDVAPYFGIGWGRPFGKDKRWTFTVDIGALYVGETDVNLSANGTEAGDPGFEADLDDEEDDVQNKLDDWPVYPVVTVGFTFKF